ncbi:MAG: hypothetical protein MRY83_01755 [Flavobacteriales bacterium]|nr:hypothetical protein [Flavobacteriales bacterium]
MNFKLLTLTCLISSFCIGQESFNKSWTFGTKVLAPSYTGKWQTGEILDIYLKNINGYSDAYKYDNATENTFVYNEPSWAIGGNIESIKDSLSFINNSNLMGLIKFGFSASRNWSGLTANESFFISDDYLSELYELEGSALRTIDSTHTIDIVQDVFSVTTGFDFLRKTPNGHWLRYGYNLHFSYAFQSQFNYWTHASLKEENLDEFMYSYLGSSGVFEFSGPNYFAISPAFNFAVDLDLKKGEQESLWKLTLETQLGASFVVRNNKSVNGYFSSFGLGIRRILKS